MTLTLQVILMFALLLPHTARTGERSSGFTTVGAFSNMRFTAEHQYGMEIHLWKDDNGLVGLVFYSAGHLMGDPPTGLMENITYDSTTGSISFTAKLTTGQHLCAVHKNTLSRDVLGFQGRISASSVSGVLKRSDALHPETLPIEENVILKPLQAADQLRYRSRADWEAASKQILKFRGPKW